MTTHVDDVTTRVGLVIDGDVVAGGGGTYPVTNPARPAEVVFDAPSTSPAQLDLAVGARRAGRSGAGRPSIRRSGPPGWWPQRRPAWPQPRATTWPDC